MGLVTRRVGYLALLAVEPAPLHTATLGMTPVATVIRESAELLERPSGVPPLPTSRTANLQSATGGSATILVSHILLSGYGIP